MPEGFLGKRGLIWRLLATYLIPGMMTAAYVILMYTSETGWYGKLWEGVGLAFVLFLWFLFRHLTRRAAITRAIGNGDVESVLELSKQPLDRALAYEIRGDWPAALAALGDARGLLAATVRVAASVETGHVAQARAAFDADLANVGPRDPSALVLARLAEARLRWAEGDRTGAETVLRKLVDHVRAGTGTRGAAYYYLWKCTDDPAHLAKAKQLAPTAWFAK